MHPIEYQAQSTAYPTSCENPAASLSQRLTCSTFRFSCSLCLFPFFIFSYDYVTNRAAAIRFYWKQKYLWFLKFDSAAQLIYFCLCGHESMGRRTFFDGWQRKQGVSGTKWGPGGEYVKRTLTAQALGLQNKNKYRYNLTNKILITWKPPDKADLVPEQETYRHHPIPWLSFYIRRCLSTHLTMPVRCMYGRRWNRTFF